jgi:uncharacterized protein (TIGR00299 family) protein
MKICYLDAFSGISGDMTVGALLDAGANANGLIEALGALGLGASYTVEKTKRRGIAATRFIVVGGETKAHRHLPHIEKIIGAAPLPDAVKANAVAVFRRLGEAEAAVHGVPVEKVHFHEVGAVDSLADIVAASWLIEALGPTHWSVSPLPLGVGRVEPALGPMPVPDPATALLLEGFAMVDDGIGGERVTPTGAAILRYLGCGERPRAPGRLGRSGIGFGTRRLNGLSNILRVMAFDDATADEPARPHSHLAVIGFEVDDQSGEDLALGLERLRGRPDVHDVLQMPAFGKKGRIAVHVQVLARPDAADAVAEACFRETTTIGLRIHLVQGRALAGEGRDVMVGEQPMRVKVVTRPGGRTGKAATDDVRDVPGHAARARLRQQAERLAEGDADA